MVHEAAHVIGWDNGVDEHGHRVEHGPKFEKADKLLTSVLDGISLESTYKSDAKHKKKTLKRNHQQTTASFQPSVFFLLFSPIALKNQDIHK